jgi:hypothetical protein
MEQLGYTLVNDRAWRRKVPHGRQGLTDHPPRGQDRRGRSDARRADGDPEHEYAYGVADKEEARKAVEDVIRRSGDPTGQVENAYVPAVKSTIEHSG